MSITVQLCGGSFPHLTGSVPNTQTGFCNSETLRGSVQVAASEHFVQVALSENVGPNVGESMIGLGLELGLKLGLDLELRLRVGLGFVLGLWIRRWIVWTRWHPGRRNIEE